MLDEEVDKDLISKEVIEPHGSLKASNAASSCISLSTLSHGVHRGREYIYQAGIEADERWRPYPLI